MPDVTVDPDELAKGPSPLEQHRPPRHPSSDPDGQFRELLSHYEAERRDLRRERYARNASSVPGTGPYVEFLMRTGHYHPEAFRLMEYRCRNCGMVETLWNSRDGVTPFSIPCRRTECNRGDVLGCPMTHRLDPGERYEPHHVPARGDRVFMDMTPERARLYARRRIDEGRNRGHLADMTAERLAELHEDIFREVWGAGFAPDIVVV